jgi:hypothetical protein
MVNEYAYEMDTFKFQLEGLAGQLKACNWTCVQQCSDGTVALKNRVQCFDSCQCYAGGKIAKDRSYDSFDTHFSKFAAGYGGSNTGMPAGVAFFTITSEKANPYD